ncbi:MAG: putative DNA binding domain-containing protein [bacterium]|nr:putative DNA binding domain-containing protein [bacterium]MDE0289848.1 putative DNA binding domain-containing protein [bacterium]MDE0440267.1 putative DNA binding domain-containing protein [bacterium]
MFHPRSSVEAAAELTAEEFAAEFPGEGEHIEFKEGVSHTRITETAMAFSNADGGVILAGVTDQGIVKGADLSVASETALRQALGQVRDLGPYRIYRMVVDGRVVVAISVGSRKDSFAQLPNGQVKQRRGASNHTLLGADLADFIARRFVRSVESSPTNLTSDDIDPELGQRLADVWQWGVPGGDSRELRARLRDNGFLVLNGARDRLSVAGALFLLPNPGASLGKAHVEVFRYRDDGIDYDRRQEFTGPLHDQVAETAAFVLEELGVDMAVVGVWRHELHRLPRAVVREAIANAVAHRSYAALGEAVRVEMRPDRVVVRSPGGLPRGVSLGSLAEQSVPRNVLVIRTLRFFGVAEDAGRGVDLMHRHMALNLMTAPEFEADDSSVTVTLRLGSEATPAERAWLAGMLTESPAAADRAYSVADGAVAGGLDPSDVQLLIRACRRQTLTNKAVRSILGVDASRASRALARLRDKGLLEQRGTGAGAFYTLNPNIVRPDGTRIEQRDFEAEVLALATGGSITNSDVREATGLDRTAAVRVFNRLVADGLLERHGSRRGTRYTLPPRRWQLSTGDMSICLDRSADGLYEASIWVGNLSAEMIALDATSRSAYQGVPEPIAQAAALLEGLLTAASQTTTRQATATTAQAWQLDAAEVRIELSRTEYAEYRASITATRGLAFMTTRTRSPSVYSGVDFRWPELAEFVKWVTLRVGSEEAPYYGSNRDSRSATQDTPAGTNTTTTP